MKRLFIVLIIGILSYCLLQQRNNIKVSAETINEIQTFKDIDKDDNNFEQIYNITNITLSEIQNKGVMVEFELKFTVEVGSVSGIRFMDNESCSFVKDFDVGSHSVRCAYEDLDYDSEFSESEIEFDVVDINGEIVDRSITKNSFRTRTVDPSSLIAFELGGQNEVYLSYANFDNLDGADKKESYETQLERLNEQLDNLLENSGDFSVKIMDRDLAYEKIYHSTEFKSVDKTTLEKTILNIKSDIENGIEKETKYTSKLVYEIDYGGHTMKLEKQLIINVGYRTVPKPLDLKNILGQVMLLLGISTDPNVESEYTNLESFSPVAYEFLETIHGALAVISLVVFTIFIGKKMLEKMYATKKVNYADMMKSIFLIVAIKFLVDNSLLLVNALYGLVVKLIGIVGAVDLDMLPNMTVTDVVGEFVVAGIENISMLNLIPQIATGQTGIMLVMFIVGLVAVIVYYALFGYVILYLCFQVLKRYINIVIYTVMMPLTICFYGDDKMSNVAKNNLKQLFIHLFKGVTLAFSIYFMILVASILTEMRDLFDFGFMQSFDQLQTLIDWGFILAGPIAMIITIKSLDKVSEKIIGG